MDEGAGANAGVSRGGGLHGIVWLALFAILLSGCASLPEQRSRPAEHAFEQPGTTELGALANSAAQRHPGKSGFYILDTGRQAFVQRAALIEAAERSIDAQYYIWNSDVSGRYLARRLLLAADRGVRVRLLLDDINVAGRDSVLATLDRHPNIQIRIYNPFAARAGLGKWLGFFTDFQRLNRRMHNKTFVADAAFGIAGGRNIGDEYFDLHPQVNFRDRDMLAAGPVVRGMSANFDAYWNNAWSYSADQLAPELGSDAEIDAQFAQARAHAGDTNGLGDLGGLGRAPAQSAAAGRAEIHQALTQMTWAPAELVYDPPAEDMHTGADRPRRTAQALRGLVESSRTEILIESAYFILGDDQFDGVKQLHERGVRVAALTNSLASNDLTTNHAGYAKTRPAMLAHGLELHELRPDAAACTVWIDRAGYCGTGAVSLHAKSVVFDRETLYVGSFNVNLRSIYLNGETALIIHSPELAQRVARDIELAMAPENSWRVDRDAEGRMRWSAEVGNTWPHEPATGWWRRFKAGLFGLLPIEKYL
ncbi:MAG TPA: phospholipase D family protein [Gammaproteobacteria bacterium]